MSDVKLYGRVFITAQIEAITGLHIGGSSAGLEIGGLDKAVIRNPLTNRPYIPGSSLRGKMRSQTEKVLDRSQNYRIGEKVSIHSCSNKEEYNANGGCPVCHVFGVPGEVQATSPTLLVVRDVPLTDESAEALDNAKTDLPFAELKTEVAIDRVTSAATPRTIERVPAGAVFGPAEFVFSIYGSDDIPRLKILIHALQFVEDDYLGGSGSRGSGKVCFRNLQVSARSRNAYGTPVFFRQSDQQPLSSVQELANALDELFSWTAQAVPVG